MPIKSDSVCNHFLWFSIVCFEQGRGAVCILQYWPPFFLSPLVTDIMLRVAKNYFTRWNTSTHPPVKSIVIASWCWKYKHKSDQTNERYPGMDFCEDGAEPSRGLVIVARFIIAVLTTTPRQRNLCLPPSPAILISSSCSPSLLLLSPRSSFPPLFLPGVRCLVPPLGCSTDAGWRHSGLILPLLMLMLKEAIGTCYFCCYAISLEPAKRY